ncbi:MAG TPA: nucleotidyltransferase domain-containing protein [Spirochaetota bacterium]|nr:nucleotidyltransferase domain-containing protein [Spirochaetota bacterium]
MDQSVIEKVKQYASIVKQTMQVKKIILYGSYARESEHAGSDIDIAVIVDRIDGDYLELSTRLFELVRDVDIRIEPILLNENLDKSGFIESIMKYGKEIH